MVSEREAVAGKGNQRPDETTCDPTGELHEGWQAEGLTFFLIWGCACVVR